MLKRKLCNINFQKFGPKEIERKEDVKYIRTYSIFEMLSRHLSPVNDKIRDFYDSMLE